MKNNEEIYPQKMLRGISSKNFIVEGILTEDVFNLDPVREDGYCEISVTWYDNQEAFDVIMSQKSDRRDEIQFQAGAAELDRVEIVTKMKVHFLSKNLSYERRPTANNQYHGNLLVKNGSTTSSRQILKLPN